MSTKAPSEAATRAWARLNLAQRKVFEAVEEDVRREGFPPLAWYDVLLELWRATDWALGQSELQAALLFAQYNLSRLLDRMEDAGLVRREPDPSDRRAKRIVATRAGLALRERMWPAYAAAIQRHVGQKLAQRESESLASILGKLLDA